MKDLTNLRTIAENATPGPWEAEEAISTWALEPSEEPTEHCSPCSRGESPIKVENFGETIRPSGYNSPAMVVHTHHAESHQVTPITGNYDYEEGGILNGSDVEFIATFDPPTVLALITRLEQAEQTVARVREVVESRSFHSSSIAYGLQAVIPSEEILRALDGEPNE